MFKQPKKLRIYFCGICLACVFLLTCGIEEYYYLPQVPQINIRTIFNTSATVNLPPLTEYYYAQYYKIYYRIYISGFLTADFSRDDTSLFNNISSTLASDYNAIYPNTDPTSTTLGTPADTLFNNRNYFELALEGADITSVLTTSGGNVRILFPTVQGGYPVLSINNGPEFRLYRSGSNNPGSNNLYSPKPDRFFRNTLELNAPENATANINADVAGRTGLSQRYAYVSMYVVAAGTNQAAFTPIYGKPTHISVFRLPEN